LRTETSLTLHGPRPKENQETTPAIFAAPHRHCVRL
jgi:hypothetical protein